MYVLLFSKKLKNEKNGKKSNVCCLFFRYEAELFAYTFSYDVYVYTSMLANEWSMI